MWLDFDYAPKQDYKSNFVILLHLMAWVVYLVCLIGQIIIIKAGAGSSEVECALCKIVSSGTHVQIQQKDAKSFSWG